MGRESSHVTETKSRDLVRSKVNAHYNNGDALFRELSERDYGIDAVIELFDNSKPTGQFALVQIKGTTNKIVPLKSDRVVSCPISTSNAKYALQSNIPVVLIYVSLQKPFSFYFVNLQGVIHQKDINKLDYQQTITIHIPEDNNVYEDLEPLFDGIRSFYQKRE